MPTACIPYTAFTIAGFIILQNMFPVANRDLCCHAHTISQHSVTYAGALPQGEDNQGVLDIQYHPWQPSHIFLQGPAYHYWVTKDYGATFKAYKTPGDQTLGFWMELKIHPRVPDWLLAKVRRKDCLVDVSSTACAHDLFISKV